MTPREGRCCRLAGAASHNAGYQPENRGRPRAIKVLPAHLAGDPTGLARFEREAKAIAALSHPNILAVHDVGRDGPTVYLVMELLEPAVALGFLAGVAAALKRGSHADG